MCLASRDSLCNYKWARTLQAKVAHFVLWLTWKKKDWKKSLYDATSRINRSKVKVNCLKPIKFVFSNCFLCSGLVKFALLSFFHFIMMIIQWPRERLTFQSVNTSSSSPAQLKITNITREPCRTFINQGAKYLPLGLREQEQSWKEWMWMFLCLFIYINEKIFAKISAWSTFSRCKYRLWIVSGLAFT